MSAPRRAAVPLNRDAERAWDRLLSPGADDLVATWVTSDQGSSGERDEAWARFLRRLNERRDALRVARPSLIATLRRCPTRTSWPSSTPRSPS